MSRGLAIGVATAAAATFAGTQAVAADYPSKPIQLIIPYDAGGAADLQDVPTVKEVGRPDLELAIGWSALYGPPGLPQDVVDKWVDVLAKVAEDKSWTKMTTKLGSIPAISSPAELESFAESQFKAMRAVAEATGMMIK